MRYQVEYRDEAGTTSTEKVECINPGLAFAKVQSLHPGCKMLRAMAYGGLVTHPVGWTNYEAVPVQRDPIRDPRPARALKAIERDGIFPFYDEVVTK